MKNFSPLIPENIYTLLENIDIDSAKFPITEQLKAGVLFTDISSFSDITEKVSQKGRYGVEIITDILSKYFMEMLNHIKNNHGHLMKYGGDSIVAVFPDERDRSISNMINCKREMFESLKSINKNFISEYNIEIFIHGAISWGNIAITITGNPNYHLDYFLTGDALEEAFILGDQTNKKEILIPQRFKDIKVEATQINNLQNVDLSKIAKKFVHKKVLNKLNTMSFNAEIRSSAVIFLHLKHESEKTIPPIDFHLFYTKLQKIVYEMDGCINKIDYNEKGYIVLITFGVPNVHDNDVERAFVCSNRIMSISQNNINKRIGITYENIYAGIIGAPQRYEYGIIGNSVNTAARLMVFAKNGEITFSSIIKDKISLYFETIFLKETSVKGIKEKIKVYKLLRKLPETWATLKSKHNKKIISPKDKQKENIANQINSKEGKIFAITGKAGTGKTFFIYKILNDFFLQNKTIEFVNLREYDKTINLYLIENIFKKYLNIDNIKENFSEIKKYCEDKLLNIDFKLLLDFLNNKMNQFSSETSDKIIIAHDLLASILFELLKNINVIAVDNLQWLDSSSTKILEKLIPRLLENNISILFTSGYKETYDFIDKFDNQKIELNPLNALQTKLFLNEEIGEVSQDAVDSIFKLSGGNHLFIREICQKIRENCDLSEIILNADTIEILIKNGKISSHIENYFVRKYELLNSEAKRLVKIASIIGKVFNLSTFNFVDKQKTSDLQIKEILIDLRKKDIIGETDISPEIEYIFTNKFMREVIYRIIPHIEKKELHNRIAEYYLNFHKNNLDSYYEIIATHFIAGKNDEMGLKYSLLTAQKAFSEASFNTGLYYLHKAAERTKEEVQLQNIKLSEIENIIKLGDFVKASQLLDGLKGVSFKEQKMKDKYLFLQTRAYFLEQKFDEILLTVADNINLVKSDFYKNSIMINYFEALRNLNMKTKFEKDIFIFLEELSGKEEKDFIAVFYGIIGLFYLDQGMYKEAKIYYEKQLATGEEINDLYCIRAATNSIGIIFSRSGDKEKAMVAYQKTLNLAEKMGDKNGVSKVLSDMGSIFSETGKPEKAFDFFDKSYKLARLVGNRIQEQVALYNIGREYMFSNDLKKALNYFRLCENICNKISHKIGLSFVQDAIGDCYFSLNEFEKAKEIYTQNLELQTALNDKEGLGHTCGNLGNIAKDYEKNYPVAVDYYKKQIEILKEVGDIDGQGRAHFNWANVCFMMGELNKSIEFFKIALELFKQCNLTGYIQASENAISFVESKLCLNE